MSVRACVVCVCSLVCGQRLVWFVVVVFSHSVVLADPSTLTHGGRIYLLTLRQEKLTAV